MQIQKPKQGYKLVEDFFKRQSEIPMDWDYPKFSEVVKVNPHTKIDEKQIPYLPMDAIDVENPHFNYFEERKLDDFSSLPKFQENDVLFASITPSTENGKTCIIENFSRKGIGSSELTVLRPSDRIVPKYLYYYIKSHRIRQFAISQMMGTTGRQRVPDYVFKKDLNFELPSYHEQQKIASILANVDSLIQQTQKIIEQTQRLKKDLMQRLLTKGIGHTKFKKIKWLFGKEIEIPESWDVLTINNLIKKKDDVKTGPFGSSLKKEIFVSKGFKVYGQENVIPDDFTIGNYYISNETFEKLKDYEVKPKDILISLVGTHGKVSLFPENAERGIINPRLLKITPEQSKISSSFMKILLNSKLIDMQIVKFSHGLTMGILNTNIIRQILFIVPSPKEQDKITSILTNIEFQIDEQQQYESKLENIKKGLMQKLLTGQIRVKV